MSRLCPAFALSVNDADQADAQPLHCISAMNFPEDRTDQSSLIDNDLEPASYIDLVNRRLMTPLAFRNPC